MPAMANITVQNAAAANVVYVASVPSAGDITPARWTQNAASTIGGHRPTITVQTRANGKDNGRRMTANYMFPVIEEIDGIDTITAKVTGQASILLPTNVSVASVEDAYVQFANLLASALFVSVAEETYAPT